MPTVSTLPLPCSLKLSIAPAAAPDWACWAVGHVGLLGVLGYWAVYPRSYLTPRTMRHFPLKSRLASTSLKPSEVSNSTTSSLLNSLVSK